jgi:hypothetical protein
LRLSLRFRSALPQTVASLSVRVVNNYGGQVRILSR